jgi:arginase
LPGKHIFLVGARDLSEYEKRFISANGIHHLNVEEVKQKNYPSVKEACLKLSRSGVKRLHLHFDVDVIDPLMATSNSYTVGDGLNQDDVTEIVNCFISYFQISSLTIASYDPSFDNDDKMLGIIQDLVELVVNQL